MDKALLLENSIEKNKNKIDEIKDNLKIKYEIPISTLLFILISILIPEMFPGMTKTLITISRLTFIFAGLSLDIYTYIYNNPTFLDIISRFKSKQEKKQLSEDLSKQKEMLDNLNKNKTKIDENKNTRIVKINELKNYKEILNNIQQCYENGLLEEKIVENEHYLRGYMDGLKLNKTFTKKR